MIYTDRLTPPNNWPPLIRYPRYYSDRVSNSFSFFSAFFSFAIPTRANLVSYGHALKKKYFNEAFQIQSLEREKSERDVGLECKSVL